MDKTPRQNRVRAALERIYENHHPPYFREYLKRYREDPKSRVFAPLADGYRQLGQVDEAIQLAMEGLEYHPDFHAGRVVLAKCFLDKKMYLEARVELERVLQNVPENLMGQRLLGDAFMALREPENALHAYKMASMLSPSDVVLAEKIRTIEQGLQQGRAGAEKIYARVQHLEQEKRESELASLGESGEGVAEEASVPIPPPPDTLEIEALWSVSEEEKSQVDALLGFDQNESDEETFRVEHVSNIFTDNSPARPKEITTQTLGDLYFSQGQFERALRIFEKTQSTQPTVELSRKIHACRIKLGVDRESLARTQKIEVLRSILKKVKHDQ